MSKRRTVYPVAGTFLAGVPAVPTIADAGLADRLVRTGAFADERPNGEQPDAVEVEDASSLDHYDSAESDADEPEDAPVAETEAETAAPE